VIVTPGLEPGTSVILMLTMGDLGSYRVASIVPDGRSDNTTDLISDSTSPTDDRVPVF
jgi:hypothetical protein